MERFREPKDVNFDMGIYPVVCHTRGCERYMKSEDVFLSPHLPSPNCPNCGNPLILILHIRRDGNN